VEDTVASAIDGLISGLKTTDLINSLMQVEAGPQTLLKQKVAKTTSVVTALQGLNTKLSSLATSSQAAMKPAAWQPVTASSTDTSVKATAAAGAPQSSLTFRVEALASKQTSVTSAGTLAGLFGQAVTTSATIVTGTGDTAKATTLDLTGVTDLAGLAKKINESGSGVSATVVNVSATETRLQLTGGATGAAATFDLFGGTVTTAQLTSGTPPTAAIKHTDALVSAQDAAIRLWPTSTAGSGTVVKSATNTFTGVVDKLDLTVSKVTPTADAAVTVTVGRDDAALKTLVSGLVANVSTVLSEITSRTKNTTTTAEDGRALVTGGVLSGDSGVRQLQSSVLAAASQPVDGVSPSTVGIVIGRDGTITYDDAKLTAALAADPAKVQKIVTEVATRLDKVATAQSDKTTGALTLKIQAQDAFRKQLDDQVSSWNVRLDMRRTALEKTYAALEVSLSNLNAQSSWLTSQLDALNANKA
jgi:flagellar hook-associated protein 2